MALACETSRSGSKVGRKTESRCLFRSRCFSYAGRKFFREESTQLGDVCPSPHRLVDLIAVDSSSR